MSDPCPMDIDIMPVFVNTRPSSKVSSPTLVRSQLRSLAKKIANGSTANIENVTFAVQCLNILENFMQQLEHDVMFTNEDFSFIKKTMMSVECSLYTHMFAFATMSLQQVLDLVERRIRGYEVFARRLLSDTKATEASLGDLHCLPGAARMTIASCLRKCL